MTKQGFEKISAAAVAGPLAEALADQLEARHGDRAALHSVPVAPAKTWRRIVTAHPDWPSWMQRLGKNSGGLSKTECVALAVVLEVEDQAAGGDAPADAPEAETAETETAETETANAAPASGGADPARDVIRRLFGSLGDGDMAGVERTIRDLIDARDAAAAEAEEAQRRAAASGGHHPAPGAAVSGPVQPVGTVTLGDLMPKAGRAALTDRAAALELTTYDGQAQPDPDYAPDPAALEALAACDVRGRNVWLYGPAGTGKSSLPEWYAAKLGRPFHRIAFDRSTEAEDLIGAKEPDGAGGFAWADGALAQAIRQPGAVILLDEPTLARPVVLAMLQTLLDGQRALLARSTGETIQAAPGVLIVAADNTAGTGDDSGQYAGTSAMNRAFLDRMAARVEVGYMPEAAEAEVLARRSGVARPAAKRMVAFAGGTRKAAASGDMAHGLGLRRLVAWADLVALGVPSERAFGMTCIAGENPDDAETVQQMASAYLDHAAIDREA